MQPKNTGSSYTVKFSKEGWKRLKRLDGRIAKKVIDKIELLGDFKSLNTVKRMLGKNKKDIFRLRAGDIRILFRVIEREKTVWVIDMGYRGSIYR